jgi:hypothetical protein
LQPSDRLKSEEELAREEKERLEKLEMERLQRMHGFKEDLLPETKHRSADDLDDGFVFNLYDTSFKSLRRAYGFNGPLIEIKVQSVTSKVVFNAFFTLLT